VYSLVPPLRKECDTFLSQIRRPAERKTDRSRSEREFFRSVRPTSLLQRFETTEEIASVVAFVCSPRSSAINGAGLRAEGGLVRSDSGRHSDLVHDGRLNCVILSGGARCCAKDLPRCFELKCC